MSLRRRRRRTELALWRRAQTERCINARSRMLLQARCGCSPPRKAWPPRGAALIQRRLSAWPAGGSATSIRAREAAGRRRGAWQGTLRGPLRSGRARRAEPEPAKFRWRGARARLRAKQSKRASPRRTPASSPLLPSQHARQIFRPNSVRCRRRPSQLLLTRPLLCSPPPASTHAPRLPHASSPSRRALAPPRLLRRHCPCRTHPRLCSPRRPRSFAQHVEHQGPHRLRELAAA
jgi:hypothetical protein